VKNLGKFALVDENGQPLSSHIDRVLRDLAPRLQREFPALTDEVTIVEVLEEAGRKIVNHERQAAPIDKLHGYAWTTVNSIATSRMRRGSMRIARATLEPDQSEVALGSLRSSSGTAEQIETDILLGEMLAQLTPEEQLMCSWKRLGFSSKEIAREQGTSIERVNTFFFRLKRKIREVVREPRAEAPSPRTAQRTNTRTA
jgi:DNA-directed RNA polymerase specialized sigma24 family protein